MAGVADHMALTVGEEDPFLDEGRGAVGATWITREVVVSRYAPMGGAHVR